MQTARKLWRLALNFVYPSSCLICSTSLPDAPGICDACAEEFEDWTQEDFECEFDQTVILYRFNDCVRAMIHALKYRGKTLPGQILGEALGQRIANAVNPDSVIVPVPLHPTKKRERGYNQSEVIARAAGRVSGVRVIPNALHRVRATSTQTRLGVFERQYNVMGAFRVRKPATIAGRDIFLIDDVITTGATLNACVLVLRAAGAQSVSVGAVASPPVDDDDLSEGGKTGDGRGERQGESGAEGVGSLSESRITRIRG